MEKPVEIKGFVVLKKRGPAKKFSKKFQQIGADVTLTILDDGKKDISLSGSVCPDLLKEILHEVAPYVDEGYISTLVQMDDPVYVFDFGTWITLKNRTFSPSYFPSFEERLSCHVHAQARLRRSGKRHARQYEPVP